MICQKYANYVQAFALSGVMTFIMSLIITIINVGFIEKILKYLDESMDSIFYYCIPCSFNNSSFCKKIVLIVASKENCS